ncbi:MAG: ABC transporter permease [Arenicellales bacterium]|jgi:NitT/TauT family transport system permease protein|nr:ABC transporter permease [Arenicellales bacterium]|tara:strand:+ start:923 stop:1882 length:960 start_codon:yes stop_codon:yes gene_type:complete
MKSSEERPREADMAESRRSESAPAITRDEVRAMMPNESIWSYRLRKFDPRVQLGRLALILGSWWLWWSETIWNGWDAISLFGIQPFPNVNPVFRASPGATWDYLVEFLPESLFWQDAWVTMKEALIAFVIASILGIAAGITLGNFQRTKKIFGPFIILINAMPKIAFLPLILVVYGVGEMSKIVLAVIIAFFIVQVPTQAAVSLVDSDLITVARTMGASNRQIFRIVTLPAISPAILGALRLASIISVQGAVFGEIFASKRGLGQRLITSANMLDYNGLFAIVFVLAIFALILNGVIGRAEKHFLRWQVGQQSTQVVSL